LWSALGQTPPIWAHIPVIVNEKRQKLSKRRDKVSLEDFLADGILPDAMVNYLMLLGWAPGNDEEQLPFDEMVRRFDIGDVNKAPAFFDIKKLTALNGDYLRALTPSDFLTTALEWVTEHHRAWEPSDFDPAVFAEVAPHLQTRIATLNDIFPNVDFLFLPDDGLPFDQAAWDKAMKAPGDEVLRGVREAFAGVSDWNHEALKDIVAEVGLAHGLKLGKAQAPVRMAVTGRSVGLPLFESLEVLGKDRTLARLDQALAKLHDAT